MSTPLDDNTIANGDVIETIHLTQLFPIVEALEDNQTNYREDIGVADAYKVDFSGSGQANEISAYQAGQQIVFKAEHANTGASTLQVVGPSGVLSAKALTKFGDEALAAGDVQAGQILLAVYNDEGSGRFELVGAPTTIVPPPPSDGSEFYREDVGTADNYELDASGGGSNPGVISALVAGQVYTFKAANSNTGASTLEVTGPGGALGAKDITKRGFPLAALDILADTIVEVVYSDEGGGRFELVGESRPEDGTGFCREAFGSADAYQIDASGTGINPRPISSLENGTFFTFKATGTNTGASTLEVFGVPGSYWMKDITKRGEPLEAGDILVNTMVAVVYNDEGGGQFELLGSVPAGGGGEGAWLFGDGSDGNVSLSSDTELFEHKFYNNLTVEEGVTLRTNGFKVYVREMLQNDGFIHASGSDGQAADGATAGSAGSSGNFNLLAWQGHWGGSGSLQSGETVYDEPQKVFYARGGDGGAGSYGAGGSGENSNVFIGERYFQTLTAYLSGVSDYYTNANNLRVIGAGMGGGGGTGNDDDAAGGGGGGSGGILWIAARKLAGAGYLRSCGGNGGEAGGLDAGGGGGGGGGIIYLLTNSPTNPYSCEVTAGYGGTGGGGAGEDGADGEDGLVVFRGGL